MVINRCTFKCIVCLFSVADYRSAFTVHNPRDGPASGTIKFISVITNIGSHYDTSSGQFTCQYPGIYVFSLHIMKDSGDSYAYCYIRKNRKNIIFAFSRPANSSLFNGGWNSVVLSLDYGDVVDLGGCTSLNTFYGSEIMTTFSGFLLKAD